MNHLKYYLKVWNNKKLVFVFYKTLHSNKNKQRTPRKKNKYDIFRFLYLRCF